MFAAEVSRVNRACSAPKLPTNLELHEQITKDLHSLYRAKNNDYGNSVHDTYEKYGLTSFLVRMEDKMNRLRSLSSKDALVADERIEDTLLDLANYAILATMELKGYDDTPEKITLNEDLSTCQGYPELGVIAERRTDKWLN